MSSLIRPTKIWEQLSPATQQQIRDELQTIFEEVIYERIRVNISRPSGHKALIYIRVSTPNQVITSKESLELQYALQQRALSLGWPPHLIEIIDTDLAITATSTHFRTGFQELAGKVALGEVGIILSREVARLSRNCTDWYPLLDVCGYKGCLIADDDGVYDPGSANGRLLLGVKGQLSEYELHTLKARLRDGLLNKARRGELALQLPVGLVRDEAGKVHKDPNLEVHQRITLLFTTFLRFRTLSKVLSFFNTNQLELPLSDPYGQIIWKKPNNSSLLTILTNPTYTGTFPMAEPASFTPQMVEQEALKNGCLLASGRLWWRGFIQPILIGYLSRYSDPTPQ